LLDALALPLQHHRPLELSDRPQHIEHEFARRCRRIEVHGEDAKPRALRLNPRHDVEQVTHRTREPIELRDDECVAVPKVVYRGLKLVALSDRRRLFREHLATACRLKIALLRLEPGDLLQSGSTCVSYLHCRASLSRCHAPYDLTTLKHICAKI